MKRFTGFIMSITLLLMVHNGLYFNFEKWQLIALGSATWTVVSLMDQYAHRIKQTFVSIRKGFLYGFILVASITLVLQWVFHKNYVKTLITGFHQGLSLIMWAGSYVVGMNSRSNLHDEVILILIIGFSISFGVNLVLRRKWALKALMIVSLYFVAQWNRYVDSAFHLLLGYMLGLLIESYGRRFESRENLSNFARGNRWSVSVASIIFACTVLALTQMLSWCLPMDFLNEGLSDQIPELWNIRDEYNYRSKESVFNFANTIYQPDATRLGGSIELDKSLMLIVESGQPGLKLRGKVKQYYSGNQWTSLSSSEEPFDPSFPKKTLLTVNIVPVNLQSSTLLTPINTVQANVKSGALTMTSEGIIRYNRALFGSKLKSYEVKAVLDPVSRDLTDVERERYLQLPANYSPEVVELTLSMTQMDQTDMDKARAIEAFLREHYTYSLTVSDYGTDDFVDHFLFEGQSGYCTYFASAMVVMTRIAGIPARYVEGYILPEQRDAKGSYRVTADRAHAWPEVYIEGVGWKAFEPTPAYGLIEIDASSTPEVKDYQKPHEAETDDVDVNAASDQGTSVPFGRLVALVMLMILVGFGLWFKMKQKHQSKELSERQKAIQGLKRTFRWMERVDASIGELQRPDQKLKFILQKLTYVDWDENDIIDAVNVTLFSDKELSADMLQTLKSYDEAVMQYMKDRLNLIQLIILETQNKGVY